MNEAKMAVWLPDEGRAVSGIEVGNVETLSQGLEIARWIVREAEIVALPAAVMPSIDKAIIDIKRIETARSGWVWILSADKSGVFLVEGMTKESIEEQQELMQQAKANMDDLDVGSLVSGSTFQRMMDAAEEILDQLDSVISDIEDAEV